MDFRTPRRAVSVDKPHAWLKMTAYPLASDVSLWETFDAKSDRVKLRHQVPGRGRSPVASHGRGHFSAERCRALQGEPAIEEPDGRLPPCAQELNGFMDQAERSFEELLAEAAERGTIDSELADEPRRSGRSRLRRGRSGSCTWRWPAARS